MPDSSTENSSPYVGVSPNQPPPEPTAAETSENPSADAVKPTSDVIARARIVDVLTPAPQQGPAPPSSKDPDDPVHILLKLMERPVEWSHFALAEKPATAQGAKPNASAESAHPDVLAQLARGGRAVHKLRSCETLSDIGRDYYGAADIARLIYQFNHLRLQAQFSRGLKMRLKMVPGTMLELPSTQEAIEYLARRSPMRQRVIEYDIS